MESEPLEEQQPTGDYTPSASEFDLHTEEHQGVFDIETETDGWPEDNTASNPPSVTVVDSQWKQISLTDLETKFNVSSFLRNGRLSF